MVDITELTAELTTDPAGVGYTPFISIGDDMALEAMMNDVAGVGAGNIDRRYADAPLLQSAVVVSEYTALSDIARQAWLLLITAAQNTYNRGEGSRGIPLDNSEVRSQIAAIWSPGTTRNNLIALQTRTGSRAEVLWGDGAVVTLDNIAQALKNVAPSTPSDLIATAISDQVIDLGWIDNSDNETGFVVERSLDGTSWEEVTTTLANVIAWSDTTLLADTTYYYRVKAYNSFRTSIYSNTATARTFAVSP